jgi:hypothetical protein
MIAGVALVWPIYRIATRLYDESIGIVAACLVALFPFLVAAGGSGYTEGLFLALIAFGTWWSMRSLDSDAGRAPAFAGAALGFAYLARPEGLGLVAVAIVAVWLNRGAIGLEWRRRALTIGASAAVSVIPYVGFLWLTTGTVRLESKSADNVAYARALAQGGQAQTDFFTAIDDDLHGVGAIMISNRELMRSVKPTPREVVGHVVRGAGQNWPELGVEIASRAAVGGPLLIILAFLGLVGRSLDRRTVVPQGIIAGSLCVLAVGFTTIHQFFDRFLLAFVLFLLVWAAAGLRFVYSWVESTAQEVGRPPAFSRGVARAVTAFLVLLMVGLSLRSTPRTHDFGPGDRRSRSTGLALRPGGTARLRIMSSNDVLAFYAGAVHLPLPRTSTATALRYLERQQPDYLILESRSNDPYVHQWLRDGVPSSHARVDRVEISGTDTLMVIRWVPEGSLTAGRFTDDLREVRAPEATP